MNLIELDRALKQLRLGGMAAVLETRLRQAQAEAMAPIDLLSCLVSDELTRRSERLLERRRKQAQFRDSQKTLDNFDFNFNKKMNRSLVFDLATGGFIARHEDALFLGPPGTGINRADYPVTLEFVEPFPNDCVPNTGCGFNNPVFIEFIATRSKYLIQNKRINHQGVTMRCERN